MLIKGAQHSYHLLATIWFCWLPRVCWLHCVLSVELLACQANKTHRHFRKTNLSVMSEILFIFIVYYFCWLPRVCWLHCVFSVGLLAYQAKKNTDIFFQWPLAVCLSVLINPRGVVGFLVRLNTHLLATFFVGYSQTIAIWTPWNNPEGAP